MRAREKIGGEPFLRGDDAIKEAFEYGLCEELVLNAASTMKVLEFSKMLKNGNRRERETCGGRRRKAERNKGLRIANPQ